MILVTAKSAKSAKSCLNCLVFDYNKFRVSGCAISSVVSAILVLGLIVAFTTTIHVSYIPAWKNDAERSHMDDTWSDMADLKSNIDILSAGMVTNPASNIQVSVPVKMGGGDIPIVSTGKSSGTLSVNLNDFDMAITAYNASGVVYDSGSDLFDLGSISYSSKNNYYINQVFEYENGALLVVQDSRSLVKLLPAVTVSKLGATDISVVVSAVELVGNKRTKSSNTIEVVYLKSNTSGVLYSNSDLVSDVNISVSTNYPNAWAQYFNTTADRANLQYGTDYTITTTDTSTAFALTGGASEDIRLSVQKITLDVWIDA
ncbi:MAG: hypothetical protein C5S44_04950 [Candidatus Methanocomedens sp.]|nr:MAG: hypothetical protein C5S44_04950 [ANME-2 cluster archaeon]